MARSSSGGAYAVALVIFGGAALIATILAIVFYTKINAAVTAQEAAETELNRYADATFRASPDATVYLSSGEGLEGNSLAARLFNENQTLKNMVLPDGQAMTATEIQTRWNEIRRAQSLSSPTLLRAMDEYVTTLSSQQAEIDRLNAQIEQGASALADANRRLEEISQAYDQAVARLEGQQTDWDTNIAEISAQRDAAMQQLTLQIAAMEDEQQEALAQRDSEITQARTRIAELDDLVERLGGREALDNLDLLETDALVGSVTTGGVVIIDKGRNQNVVRGMTFEVFVPTQVVALTDGNLRGKATIEVYEVNENNALARVVRTTRSATVDPGDHLVNLVYDPNRTFRLFVYGNFDLEGDGNPNAHDRSRLNDLIESWGAEIIDELTPQADYVVLGQLPEVPEEPGTSASPEEVRIFNERRAAANAYLQVQSDALDMGLPILNQNRLFQLIGRYN